MKIVIATPIYPPEIGGPATYTKELVKKLCNEHECIVVAYTDNTQKIPNSKLVPVSKQAMLPVRLFKYFFTLLKEMRGTDVLYVQNAMAAGLPAMLAGKIRRKPVILKFVGDEAWERATQHGKTNKRLIEFLYEPDAGWRYTLMTKVQGFVLRNVSLVTTPSAYLSDIIQKTYRISEDRIKTNYNAAEKTTDAPFTAEKKDHQIMTSARLVNWKGVDGIILAVKNLIEDYPDVHLVINGDGPERENLEQLAKELEIDNCVTFTGNVSHTETWHTRKESEVYVLNSTYEGLPHTALTSFAAKIPIVATDISGTNEAVYDGVNGLLIPTNDPEALTSAIKKLFDDKKLQEKLVSGGEKILKEKFSWDSHVTTLTSFFESIISKPIK